MRQRTNARARSSPALGRFFSVLPPDSHSRQRKPRSSHSPPLLQPPFSCWQGRVSCADTPLCQPLIRQKRHRICFSPLQDLRSPQSYSIRRSHQTGRDCTMHSSPLRCHTSIERREMPYRKEPPTMCIHGGNISSGFSEPTHALPYSPSAASVSGSSRAWAGGKTLKS